MTRKEWEARTIRAEEKSLGVPAGWWGIYDDLHSPRGVRVKFSGRFWTVRDGKGDVAGQYDSRAYAIKKARSLDAKSR